MNKKLMTYSLVGLFAFALITAGLASYFGNSKVAVNAGQSLYLENEVVNLVGSYDYVSEVTGWTCSKNSVGEQICSASIDTLSGKAVIFRADVVNKLEDDYTWDRLINVSNTNGDDLVVDEVYVSYAYPANWDRTVDSIGAVDGCWESLNYGSGSDAYFRTAIGNELPKVVVGAYDGHEASSSQPNGYEMCVEHTESTNIENGDLIWNGGSEPAYGLGRCNTLEPVNDEIGCMAGEVSYDRPSYIIVEFPVATSGDYTIEFKMVPQTD